MLLQNYGVNLVKKENPYEPHLARIVRTLPQMAGHRLFQLRFEDEEVKKKLGL